MDLTPRSPQIIERRLQFSVELCPGKIEEVHIDVPAYNSLLSYVGEGRDSRDDDREAGVHLQFSVELCLDLSDLVRIALKRFVAYNSLLSYVKTGIAYDGGLVPLDLQFSLQFSVELCVVWDVLFPVGGSTRPVYDCLSCLIFMCFWFLGTALVPRVSGIVSPWGVFS